MSSKISGQMVRQNDHLGRYVVRLYKGWLETLEEDLECILTWTMCFAPHNCLIAHISVCKVLSLAAS